VRTVHELGTNKRMGDSWFEYSWFHSWMVVPARVESLPLTSFRDFVRGRMGESIRQVKNLFESLLAESFGA
jgi:hypothetical protein